MARPDQERFDKFARQVEVLDGALEIFGKKNGFDVEVNAYRTPCRVLRRQREAIEIIDIYLDGDWKSIEYSEYLPCVFSVCSYFESSPDDGYKLYKIDRLLASEESFLLLAPRVNVLLGKSLNIFDEWSAGCIVATGSEVENLKRMYERGAL